MTKHFLSLILLMVVAFGASAQTQSFRFEKTTHDFGVIKKSAGPVTYTFKFRNVNAEKASVAVVEIQPLCDCLSPKFSAEPIKHWEMGEITVTYNPAKIADGKFLNSMLIVSDFFEDNYTLQVIGTVVDDLPKENPGQKTIAEMKKEEGFRKIFSLPMGFDRLFVDSTDANFRKYVKDVVRTLKAEGGKGTIVIEACSSYLTSKKYENKIKLSEERAEEALRIFVAMFRTEGGDDSQVVFSANPFIDGPKLESEGNKAGFQDFEYVKFKMK